MSLTAFWTRRSKVDIKPSIPSISPNVFMKLLEDENSDFLLSERLRTLLIIALRTEGSVQRARLTAPPRSSPSLMAEWMLFMNVLGISSIPVIGLFRSVLISRLKLWVNVSIWSLVLDSLLISVSALDCFPLSQ